MSIEYSIEDYTVLVDKAPPYNIINVINCHLATGHAFNDASCTDIKKTLTTEYPEMSKLFYDIPLEETPLLLNHDNALVKAIAIWRLQVGK